MSDEEGIPTATAIQGTQVFVKDTDVARLVANEKHKLDKETAAKLLAEEKRLVDSKITQEKRITEERLRQMRNDETKHDLEWASRNPEAVKERSRQEQENLKMERYRKDAENERKLKKEKQDAENELLLAEIHREKRKEYMQVVGYALVGAGMATF